MLSCRFYVLVREKQAEIAVAMLRGGKCVYFKNNA